MVHENTRMNPEIKREWLEALRSDNYAQGQGELRSANNDFCCLGVLCDLAERAGVVRSERASTQGKYINAIPPNFYTYSAGSDDRSSGGLPIAVQKWSGVDSASGMFYNSRDESDNLADVNDGGASFAEIADLIEKHF